VHELATAVRATSAGHTGTLAAARATLSADEVVSNAGVMLFGGIETSEGMTANALAHVLADARVRDEIRHDRSLVANAVDESLRLEPAVVRVDRYATTAVEIGGARIGAGDFVAVSLAGANRDPAVFPDPDRFDPRRPNAKQHLTFVHGPHACPAMHLARLEAQAALSAVLDALDGVRLDPATPPPRPAGTVFRKPPRVDAVWSPV
jgi:cytochrome P450